VELEIDTEVYINRWTAASPQTLVIAVGAVNMLLLHNYQPNIQTVQHLVANLDTVAISTAEERSLIKENGCW